MSWVVVISPRGEIGLYEREGAEERVSPERWIGGRTAVVASGVDWTIFGDLEGSGPDFWVGPGGVHVAGWGILCGVTTEGVCIGLRTEQLRRIQAWRWRNGCQLVEVSE